MDTMTVSATSAGQPPEVTETDERIRALWFALRRLTRVLDRRAEAVLQQNLGVSAPTFLTLAAVGDHGGAVNQQEIADRIGITKGTLSRQVATAVDAGLVTAEIAPHSRREKAVRLTPSGTAALATGIGALRNVVDSAGVDDGDMVATLDMLSKLEEVYDNSGSTGVDPAGVPRLWFLARKVVSLIDRGGEALFRDHMGINLTRFLVLSAIARRPGDVGPRDLATRLGLHTASISRQLDAAVREGLISTEHSRDPERAHRLTAALTDDGLALVARGEGLIEVAQPGQLAGLDQESMLRARTVVDALARRAQHNELTATA